MENKDLEKEILDTTKLNIAMFEFGKDYISEENGSEKNKDYFAIKKVAVIVLAVIFLTGIGVYGHRIIQDLITQIYEEGENFVTGGNFRITIIENGEIMTILYYKDGIIVMRDRERLLSWTDGDVTYGVLNQFKGIEAIYTYPYGYRYVPTGVYQTELQRLYNHSPMRKDDLFPLTLGSMLRVTRQTVQDGLTNRNGEFNGRQHYVIRVENVPLPDTMWIPDYIWIDKETFLITKMEFRSGDIREYILEKNVVTEQDIQRPNI